MVLHDGAIAEMKTGEGKTLTATLAVFLNTLAGDAVHVVTVNDYLARRDAEWMAPIYNALGVSVGVIQTQQSPEVRRDSRTPPTSPTAPTPSSASTTCATTWPRPSRPRVQPDHVFAIVDEVDNILIDEARTPLIISGQPEKAADTYYTFARLAKQMVGVESKPKLKSLGESRDTSEAEHDYEYDEKHKTVAPTEAGVAKAEKFIGVENLYVSEHGTLVNHLIQSLKAESLFKRDDDYAVIDGEVKIIDEFTGRILEGRRWSEGLHQAVEAKEGVAIREENQTLATITLQNYFRLYDKLSGMTGTALTEAQEFMKIYEMPVVEVPTNQPMVRADENDLIYKTKNGKWKALVNEVSERHEKGQPTLVGTISVEVSEMLGEEFKRRGIEHVVLNAKPEYAQREGETVAQAGRIGAVTIATNMAGRGVDIKLGGDPEQMAQDRGPQDRAQRRRRGLRGGGRRARSRVRRSKTSEEGEKVRAFGGLFICGTERHESRRIDNQLRGRAGRQGDPGESRFFLSAEDELIRLFAGERIYKILDRLGPVDDDGEEYPLEAKMLSKQIENAQKKVEQQNFLIRKRVLEYDDVLNEQRRVIYKYRREILEGRDMSDVTGEELGEVIARLVDEYTQGDVFEEWDIAGLQTRTAGLWPLQAELATLDANTDREEIREILTDDALGAYDRREERARRRADALPRAPDPAADHRSPLARAPLRDGLPARGNPPPRLRPDRPLVAYKNEGFSMFRELMDSIWEEFARIIFHVEVNVEPAQAEEHVRARAPARRGPVLRRRRGRAALRAARRARPGRGRGRPGAPRRRAPSESNGAERAARAPTAMRPPGPWSRTSTPSSAATTPAGAARARSTRSATGLDRPRSCPSLRRSLQRRGPGRARRDPLARRRDPVRPRAGRGPRRGAILGDAQAERRVDSASGARRRQRARRPCDRRPAPPVALARGRHRRRRAAALLRGDDARRR